MKNAYLFLLVLVLVYLLVCLFVCFFSFPVSDKCVYYLSITFKKQKKCEVFKTINHRTLHVIIPLIRSIERFRSRGQHTCKFTDTKGSVYIRKEFNSQRIGLVHQHGRRFIVLEHQYGCRDVMSKRSI